MDHCSKCGRPRPGEIFNPTCPKGSGYCNWVDRNAVKTSTTKTTTVRTTTVSADGRTTTIEEKTTIEGDPRSIPTDDVFTESDLAWLSDPFAFFRRWQREHFPKG